MEEKRWNPSLVLGEPYGALKSIEQLHNFSKPFQHHAMSARRAGVYPRPCTKLGRTEELKDGQLVSKPIQGSLQ